MDVRLEKELSIYSFILVIILSKSGEVSKSIYLYKQLKIGNVIVRIVCYNNNNTLCEKIPRSWFCIWSMRGTDRIWYQTTRA